MLCIKFEQDWPTSFRDIQVWKCWRRTGKGSCYSISSPCEPSAQVSYKGKSTNTKLMITVMILSFRTDMPRAPAAQRQMRQMRKKISFGPTFFHLAQTFGAYFFRRHFYFFLCYKRYELRKRLMTPNKQCRWRVFLNWWWPLVIIGYKVRPIIDTYLVDWTWCLFN